MKLANVNGGTDTAGWTFLVGKYFPYGQERPSATTDGKEKFATYFRDSETGLDYAINRYHQPGMGRFMTPDPYMASGGPSDPGSWNRYAYVGGDPIKYGDPTGLLQGCPNGCGTVTPPPPPPPAPTDCSVDWWLAECGPQTNVDSTVACGNPSPGCPSGPAPPAQVPCWADLGKIGSALNDILDSIINQAVSKDPGLSSQQVYALEGVLETSLESEVQAIAAYGFAKPDPNYYQGGHFNLIISSQALQDALGGSNSPAFIGFQQAVLGRANTVPYYGSLHGSLTGPRNGDSADHFHLDTSNPLQSPVGLFGHFFRDVVGGNLGNPCLDPAFN